MFVGLLCFLLLTIVSSTPLGNGDSLSGIWPRCQGATADGSVAVEVTADFAFKSASTSPRLLRAFTRYESIIREQRTLWSHSPTPKTVPLDTLIVKVPASLSKWPRLGDDESFELVVDGSAHLSARSFSGVIRGLEAFSQLTIRLGSKIVINSTRTKMACEPVFEYRGVMIDTARHFETVKEIKTLLDAMSYSGLNVLHWHLTDAQSFPWNSTAEPSLIKGAYRPDLVYQRADLKEVVAYAADRAIRVIPELDMPGHAGSLAAGRPDVVIQCGGDVDDPLYDGTFELMSQLDPSQEATYELLDSLIGELSEIFPDEYVHIGGDEVQISCYNSSASLKEWMVTRGWDTSCPPHEEGSSSQCGGQGGLGYNEVIAYFIKRVQTILKKHSKQPCGWQEVWDHYGNTTTTPTPPIQGLASETVVYEWLSPEWGWSSPQTVTDAGWRVVSTLGLYLSSDADNAHWQDLIAQTHPLSSKTTDHAAPGYFNVTNNLLLGAEACLWGEQTGYGNMNLRLWPRAAAMAEALWSGPTTDLDEVEPRLLRHSCRLAQRGVPVTPLQPGFC